ncbi:hypothetical protein LTR78_004494 [Recurvomyces mirabilis]|uniref:F-box domain-containing protein n=1 Tax=Recurvomyces mirabilis TaxID=574656 RepID=A0AAE0WQ64_9PEZI|nr:hypothetical protein LTR78_004494 [Recurvomyces mirabilis]KAK5155840.1 hypothetical protein LTS14_005406 [Recurvomyces mirabilis]
MPINDLPREILSDILLRATQLNEADGESYTYGLTQAPLPLQKAKLTKYWHDWVLSYNFEHVFERKWRGAERWAELTLKRPKYSIYELIDKPSGYAVYRDPYGSLKLTNELFATVPSTASHVRRLWFNGFYEAESDKLILSVISSCTKLQYLSVPWTILRRATAKDWVNLLNGNTGRGRPLHSLELTAVCLPEAQACSLEDDHTPNPLEDSSVDFSSLKRLKIFGNTLHKPVSDDDLHHIAKTATNLECLDFTNLSTISVAGMLALVKASRNTLQVLEHSPRSSDGFYHPYPGDLESGEHICELLANLPQMRDLSISIPYMCADLFANHDVKWVGELQVRATDVCGCDSNTSPATRVEKLSTTLESVRKLIAARRRMHSKLSAELFFAGCIFEPEKKIVHGDFALAEISSGGRWPEDKQPSTLGPYGQTGTYGKEEGFWDAISEEEYLYAVSRQWVQL